MLGAIRTSLAVMSVLLILAAACLSLSLIVLNPPHANLLVWFALATVFTLQSALVLTAVTTAHPPAWLRRLVVAGAVCLIGIAVWRVRSTLAAPHFEGYNLLL